MAITHPASFRKILLERVIHKAGITNYHFIESDSVDVSVAVREGGRHLTSAPD
jgi:hypothetical protein